MMNAIILSAGLGARMRPLTAEIPKPLLPIVNHPIIEIIINKLVNCGLRRIGVNLYYKSNEIKKFLDSRAYDLDIIIEKRLSGTGGGILNFRKFIDNDVLVHNCEILSDFNLKEAIRFQKRHRPIATLLLTKNSRTNFVKIDKNLKIVGFLKRPDKKFFSYTGIAILAKKIFEYLPNKKKFSIIEVIKKIIDDGKTVLGLPMDGKWYDIGSFYSYWCVHRDIMKKPIGSVNYIHPSSSVKTKNLKGFIVIHNNCNIDVAVQLKNTIVFANTNRASGQYADCLLSNNFCIRV
jgi:NDP-sugar pyrophosphorylase family protein